MASSENVLLFNLDCDGLELNIELQDFDTVEDLKNYVQSLYGIPISEQHIEGWAIEPDCDRGVLQQYTLPFVMNKLKIRRKDSMKSHTNVKLLSEDSEASETDAAKSCVRKTARYFIVSQTTLEARDLRTLMSVIGEKMLLLYFHNDQEDFSKTFCKSLAQTAMKTVLKKFCILGWDVAETKYHEALVKVLSENDLQGLVCLVESKVSAAICVQIVNGSVTEVVSCLMGEMSEGEIMKYLEEAQKSISESAPSNAGTSEIDAVKSCVIKIARLCEAVKFETKELKQLQSESSTSRKTLLLFLYNDLDEFSKTFCENLANSTIRQILDNFHILGWDIGESKYHNALSNTLSSSNLPNLVCLIESGVSALICLQHVDESLVTVSILNGDVSSSEILNWLKQMQPLLKTDEFNNQSLSEIDAAKSCVRKLARYLISSQIKFETRRLETVLEESCLTPLRRRKTMMLYLHNEEDEFSKTFCRNLMEMTIKSILADFCILGWDVSNTDYHEALLRALNSQKLEALNALVEARISALICFQNIDGCIVTLCYLNGPVSDNELLEELKQVQNLSNIDAEQQNNIRDDNENYDITSTRYQQIMADMLGDRDYDLIDFDQKEVLERKIGFALYGPPQDDQQEYNAVQMENIGKLRDIIMTESNEVAQYLDQVEISFIYNCIEPLPEEKIKRARENDYNPDTDLMPIPLFVLRKCRESLHPCRIFIDNTGRVYSSWQDYKENNKLHECIMVLPLDGRYQVNRNGDVLLEKLPSPACGAAQQALRVADVANTGVGLATGGMFLAAALTPVLPAVLVGAAIAGAATGVYSIARSATNLYDRSTHKESVSITDSEARGAYLNIVAGSLGFVGTGANMVVAQLASNGANISRGAIYTVNTLNAVNLGASGVSVINSGVDVFYQWYYEDRTPSLLTIVQLSSSVLFFGNALYNYKSAGNIIEESQARTLKEYQDSLRSNRHRRTFNKMTKETIRQNDGNVNAGRAEVIKTVRNIQNRDEVFASLTRHNRQMNRNGVRFSASNGQIHLNGQNVDMGTFMNLNRNEVNTFLGKLPMKPNVTQADIRSMGQVYTVNNLSSTMAMPDVNSILTYSVKVIGFLQGDVQSKIISALSLLLSTIPTHFKQMLNNLFPDTDSRWENLLDAVFQFFAAQAQQLDSQYERWRATNSPEDYNPLFIFVDTDENRKCKKFLEDVVRACFNEGHMRQEALNNLLKYFYAWITEKLLDREEDNARERRRAAHSSSVRIIHVKCDVCRGYYYSKTT